MKHQRQINYKWTTLLLCYINLMYLNIILDTFIPLPWQVIISGWCDCNYRNPWTVKEYCSLFIGTGHSLWGITIMPLIKVYNIDSDLYGLKGHSIFKSVCNTEASWKGTFGHPIQTVSAESRFFLQDLRRRSIVPTLAPFAVLDRFS